MKVTVNQRKCCGMGLCIDKAPEIFEWTADSKHSVVKLAVIPEESQNLAREAAALCPYFAIDVED
jgi:ferredoxin